MLYWLMDLRYRAIASEELYDYYMNTKHKCAYYITNFPLRKAEDEYQDLHTRMAWFGDRLRRRKEAEQVEVLGAPPGARFFVGQKR